MRHGGDNHAEALVNFERGSAIPVPALQSSVADHNLDAHCKRPRLELEMPSLVSKHPPSSDIAENKEHVSENT